MAWCRARRSRPLCASFTSWPSGYGLVISNIFHAGDGNLHPLILFDPRKPGQLEKVQRASDEILEYCIARGGSITGEHGVGMEKMEMMEPPVLRRDARHDPEFQATVRSRMPSKSGEGAAHGAGLHGDSTARR